MKPCQSPATIVQSSFSLKSWLDRRPSVEEARPGQCPCCGAASRPVGARLNLHGHGVRDRQVRGPLEEGEAPQLVVVSLRRYLCCRCGGTMTVGPRGLIARRLFSAAAIGVALCLLGVVGLGAARVRHTVNPLLHVGPTAAQGWAQLGRWVQAVREGRLFRGLVRGPVPGASRAGAQRVALALSTFSPPQMFPQSLPRQVFVGAAQAA